MRYALIDSRTNVVVNVIMLDGPEQWGDPAYYVIQSDEANIGDSYDGVNFSPA
jgi:hypothetical protein